MVVCLPYFARAATSREVTLTLGSAYRCMASPSREADGAAPPSATTPRFVFGFSTGHVGTTSLSQRSMYECSCTTRAHCKCELAGFGFFHETGRRRGLQESHPSLYEWHEAPLAAGGTLAAREADLVARAYLPRWSRHARAIVLSHDTLLLYKGILATIPHAQLLFVRIRRARHEFVASFSRYDKMERDWYRYEPSGHECVLPVAAEAWEAMGMRERAAWFHDETEARWRQLRAEQPHVQVLEVEWSKEVEK